MEIIAPQYQCRVCDNVSWKQERCHDQLMEELCFCGSGKLLVDCHQVFKNSTPLNHHQQS